MSTTVLINDAEFQESKLDEYKSYYERIKGTSNIATFLVKRLWYNDHPETQAPRSTRRQFRNREKFVINESMPDFNQHMKGIFEELQKFETSKWKKPIIEKIVFDVSRLAFGKKLFTRVRLDQTKNTARLAKALPN
ncbi:unnamed protein product [Bursaphelenchus okinawaensis]|uniref:Uncharacterized protein n=1 Tax=Bursaphelenchus okinawaensis TaxID=465554 RepID=A0A811LJS3_9BILA|nr:unnamed protein product [Bursaphelenchus okinawaensis]CAG9127281.1 unnamed protein product [Bursaphelenchus okinawaensis]